MIPGIQHHDVLTFRRAEHAVYVAVFWADRMGIRNRIRYSKEYHNEIFLPQEMPRDAAGTRSNRSTVSDINISYRFDVNLPYVLGMRSPTRLHRGEGAGICGTRLCGHFGVCGMCKSNWYQHKTNAHHNPTRLSSARNARRCLYWRRMSKIKVCQAGSSPNWR